MKNFLLFFSFLLYTITTSFAQWTPLNSGTALNLYEIFFKDSQTGFCVGGGDIGGYPVAGGKGTILKTVDGGLNWVKVFEDTTIGINKITANGNNITAFGLGSGVSNAYILQSTDNGSTWNSNSIGFSPRSQSPMTTRYLMNELYVLTDNLVLKKFVSSTWQNVANGAAVFDVNANGIYIAEGPPLYFRKSHDNGISWDTNSITVSLSPSPWTGANMRVFGDTVIISTTYPPVLAYSFDEGITWNSYQDVMMPSNCFINSPKIITGFNGSKTISRSQDGGQTFINQDTMANYITDLYFVNENLGFLCGENGMIYKTTNGGGGTTGINETKQLKKNINIYPNPAKNLIEIKHEAGITIQKILLQDISGKTIKTQKGNANVLNIESVAAGNYLIMIQTNKGVITEKVVVEK